MSDTVTILSKKAFRFNNPNVKGDALAAAIQAQDKSKIEASFIDVQPGSSITLPAWVKDDQMYQWAVKDKDILELVTGDQSSSTSSAERAPQTIEEAEAHLAKLKLQAEAGNATAPVMTDDEAKAKAKATGTTVTYTQPGGTRMTVNPTGSAMAVVAGQGEVTDIASAQEKLAKQSQQLDADTTAFEARKSSVAGVTGTGGKGSAGASEVHAGVSEKPSTEAGDKGDAKAASATPGSAGAPLPPPGTTAKQPNATPDPRIDAGATASQDAAAKAATAISAAKPASMPAISAKPQNV
jgi:hypothetical protein